MSLDTNCERDGGGNPLPRYTLSRTSRSEGGNVFANPMPADYNIYVFPPLSLALFESSHFRSGFPRCDHARISRPGYSPEAILVRNPQGPGGLLITIGKEGFGFSAVFFPPGFLKNS